MAPASYAAQQVRTGPNKYPVSIRSHQITRVNLRGDVIPPQLRALSYVAH